jgi:hypothetical protein
MYDVQLDVQRGSKWRKKVMAVSQSKSGNVQYRSRTLSALAILGAFSPSTTLATLAAYLPSTTLSALCTLAILDSQITL